MPIANHPAPIFLKHGERLNLRLAILRLELLRDLLQQAHDENSLYAVPIRPRDDYADRQIVLAWARSPEQACIDAVSNSSGSQWADVDGPAEFRRSSPVFTEEMIKQILDLPLP